MSPLVRIANSDRMVAAFREKDPPTWADVAAFCALIDRVGRYQVEEFQGSSFLPVDRVLEPIFREELGHISFGVHKLAELCGTEEGKAQAQAAVDRWVPKGLDMFGRSGSRRSERFIYWGLKRRTNAEAREQYAAEVAGVLSELGLKMPDPEKDRAFV